MSRSLLIVACLLCACGERRHRDAPPEPENVTTLEGLPGTPCGSPLMVVVSYADSTQGTFCIDRFEASLDGGTLGNAHQAGGDDLSDSTDGSTKAAATVNLAIKPAASVSWYQAKAACKNAGKRLCTIEEWERACRGPAGLVYPYGDDMDEKACQGFFAFPEERPEVTGSLKSCGSAFGVYDMSGNVEEWTASAAERVPGSLVFNDRAVRGGSFKSNVSALACVGPEFHEAPGSADVDRGFRCCSDGPL